MLARSLMTWPSSGNRLPAMICSCVVLPAPLIPACHRQHHKLSRPDSASGVHVICVVHAYTYMHMMKA